MYRIVMTGESWHGSDCTSLARGFRELGHAVELIGSDQFFPSIGRRTLDRVIRRTLTPWYRRLYNDAVLSSVKQIRPDLVVVFKGSYLMPGTLDDISRLGIWLCNFYPDVSMFGHRGLDPRIFRKFNHIFTTKSFGLEDLSNQLGITNASFLSHGFDPLVHRPLPAPNVDGQIYDVSFIGTWSPKKEQLLSAVARSSETLRLSIWGDQWEKATCNRIKAALRHTSVFGDFYAQAISYSKINLGLLSERREGASSGDQITSRTFHIPASGGFMLHERTSEVSTYFTEGQEIACFDGPQELIEKVHQYLINDKQREAIAQAGYERCLRENRMANRAEVMLNIFKATETSSR